MLTWIALIICAYFLGSIPFPYLVARVVARKDLRYSGNGNVGARNAIRVAGRNAGLVALALDALKGAMVYWLCQRLAPGSVALCVGASMMMVGHWFPVWLRFRGGIGQGAATGFSAAMWPLPALAGSIVFLIALPLVPLFNIAYAVAAVTAIAVSAVNGRPWQEIVCFVGLMLATIAKKLADMPRQRRMLDAPNQTQ